MILDENTENTKNLDSTLNSEENPLALIGSLLALEDEKFKIVAPRVLFEMEKTMKDSNNRLAILQAVQSMGFNVTMLNNEIETSLKNIDLIEDDKVSKDKKEFLKKLILIVTNAVNEVEGMQNTIVNIPVEIIREDVRLPEYAHLGDSGMDVFALEDYTIAPGETKLIPTGIKMAIPLGYEIQIRPKSGRSLKTKLRIANTPATIDSSYRGEIGVIVENIESPIKNITYDFDEVSHKPIISSIEHGSSYTINKGEKFCQLVLVEVPKVRLEQISSVDAIESERGEGGFGSSGLK